MKVYYELKYKQKRSTYSKDDELPVVVRYYYQGKRLSVSTPVRCKIKDWDDNWRKRVNQFPIQPSDPLHKEKNLQIKQKLVEVRGITEKIEKDELFPSVDLVKSYLRENKVSKVKRSLKKIHFLVLFEMYGKWVNSETFINSKSYVLTLNPPIRDVIEYTTEYQLKHKVLLLPSDIDEDWVNGLIKWCYKKGLQPSTIRKRTKVLSHFSSWCNDNGYGDFKIKRPKRFSPSEEREVICLFREEVNDLFYFSEFDITNPNHTKVLEKHKSLRYIEDSWVNNEGNPKSKTYTSYEVYKDMMLFLCNVGCRYGDMVKMRVGDFIYDDTGVKGNRKGYFRFFMEKSRVRKEVKVSINQMTDKIFRKYVSGKNSQHFIFPRTEFGNPISNQKFNKHCKHIGQIIGKNFTKRLVRKPEFDLTGKIIDGSDQPYPLYQELVSHIGRRTFIREHIERGTPIRTIMKMTGHSSQKVFDGYYSVLDKDILRVNDDFYSQTLKVDYNSPIDVPEGVSLSSDVENELKRLQEFYDKGILPENIHEKRVEQLLGMK